MSDQPVHLEFDVSLEKLTWDDLIFLQEGVRSYRYMKELAARFMVDAAGQPVEQAAALKLLGSLSEKQVSGVVAQVMAAIREARANAVPPLTTG